MSGLEVEFDGKVIGKNEDATTPEAKREVERHGFGNHGIVIRDGRGEVVFTQPDHEVAMEDVRAKLNELVSG